MNGDGGSAPTEMSGVSTYTSRNGQWRITTRKAPILKADPIDTMNVALRIPVPEMIFGDNFVEIQHLPSSWKINFNTFDALDRVSKTANGMLQVAYSKEWQKNRQHHHEGIKEVVKPFDWSYSTDYSGTTSIPSPSSSSSPDSPSQSSPPSWEPTTDPIRLDLLSRPDPILFFDDVPLYEDELADNGAALYTIKIRCMPSRLLLLARFFLRLDGVIVRVRDTRVYVEFEGRTVVRQYTEREEEYEVLRGKLVKARENAVEALREPNRVVGLLRVVDERLERFVVP